MQHFAGECCESLRVSLSIRALLSLVSLSFCFVAGACSAVAVKSIRVRRMEETDMSPFICVSLYLVAAAGCIRLTYLNLLSACHPE